jgi:hypothetical protein
MRKRCTVIILTIASVISASAVGGSDHRAARRDRAVPRRVTSCSAIVYARRVLTRVAQQPAGRRQRHVTPESKP